MSEVTYKKVVDVEQIDTLGESTTLFVNDGGSMKQMGAAALGAVKSVNGVLPDENGDIEVSVAEKIAFVYMPEMGDLLCEKTAAEIHELYSNVATAHGLCFILRVYDFTDPMASTPDYLYNKIEVESIQNGETYYKLIYHIHFGDVVPPVLVDAINNTITLDPDWVAPTSDVTIPSGATLTIEEGATVVDNAGALGGSGGIEPLYVELSEDETTLVTSWDDIVTAHTEKRPMYIVGYSGFTSGPQILTGYVGLTSSPYGFAYFYGLSIDASGIAILSASVCCIRVNADGTVTKYDAKALTLS